MGIEICINDQGQPEPIKNLKIPLNIGCWARVAGGKCQASYIVIPGALANCISAAFLDDEYQG